MARRFCSIGMWYLYCRSCPRHTTLMGVEAWHEVKTTQRQHSEARRAERDFLAYMLRGSTAHVWYYKMG